MTKKTKAAWILKIESEESVYCVVVLPNGKTLKLNDQTDYSAYLLNFYTAKFITSNTPDLQKQ